MQKTKNEKGQTLLIIIVLMLFALTTGIVISSRLIKSLRSRVVSSDASKAISIAEAAIERMLIIPNEELSNYITYNSCGSACHVEIIDTNGQLISADVTLAFSGDVSGAYDVKLKQEEVFQLNLGGFTSGESLDICWNNEASVYSSYIYSQSGSIKTEVYAYNSINTYSFGNNFDVATSKNGYENCYAVTASNTPKALRIKAYYEDAEIFIIPSPSVTIPVQGIIITSTGKVGEVTKVVQVLKTSPMALEFFDYAIQQRSEDFPLSNRSN